ncbi:MAG TPA: DUF6531 domain-containing protein [Pyrinomonadaceae bacterium]|nr:DUF6531 domain-containing protein [Pyrinomonadaceae bacterium]
MRRLIFLSALCVLTNFLVFITATAQPTSPPVATDNGVYVVKEPFVDGTFTLTVPAPGVLSDDWWQSPYTTETNPILPGAWHRSGGYFSNGGFFYKSAGGYVGIDSFGYKIHYHVWTWINDTARVTVSVIPRDDAENAGYMCLSTKDTNKSANPLGAVGEPVNVTNGNMWIEQSDYALPGIGENIEIKRFYNSIIQTSGQFGFGWSTKYDESLWIYPEDEHQEGAETYNHQMLRLNMPDGRAVYFGREKRTNHSKQH